MSTPNTANVTPKCRECGSTDLTATSSQQMRRINGHQRLVADVVCNACGHTWWSHDKAILALSREADAARVEGADETET